jgi:cytochrome c-type biogenesis protein CcmH
MRAALALLLVLLMNLPALAVRPDEMLADPALEARARAISRDLRCLVCQNESIDDSDADLAHDLRVIVRERLKAGDTDEQAVDYIVARYGEYVLLTPRFEPRTLLLWLAAPTLLAVGGAAIHNAARRKREQAQNPPHSEEERHAIERLEGSGRG